MKGLVSVQNLLDEIISDLIFSGIYSLTSELTLLRRGLDEDSKRLESLMKIEQMCHPKVLGDFCVLKYSGWDWINKVGKLGNKCRRVIKQIEVES